MLEEFKTIKDLERYFINEEVSRQYLENYRWNGNPTCPKCGSTKYYTLRTVKQYCCKTCRKNYSVRVGTIFDNSAVPLSKWFTAIYLLSNDKRSMSSVQAADWIGVTQKTAWFMNHRIRTMMNTNNVELMQGTIQIDEVYTGGKKDKVSKARKLKMIRGSGAVGKVPVIGIANTETGEKRYFVTTDPTVSAALIENIIVNNVDKDSILVTDGSTLYPTIGKDFNEHIVLNHSKEEFGRDGYYTNDIEGSFRHFRIYLDATFKGSVRPWHLAKYANEFVYKNNRREKVKSLMAKKPKVVLKTILTAEHLKKVLRYYDLVLLNPNHNKKWDDYKKAS
jgi:transposase-like protein